MGKADTGQGHVGFSQTARSEDTAEGDIGGPKGAGNANRLPSQIGRFGNIGLRFGKDRNRETGVPVHHIAHRQPLCPPQHHLITAADHELKFIYAHQLEVIILKAVIQADIQSFGRIKALFDAHIIGRKLYVGDVADP